MAKKRKPAESRESRNTAGRSPAPPPAAPGPAARRRWIVPAIVAGGALLLIAATLFLRRQSTPTSAGESAIALPPPRATFVREAVEASDFVGSDACASCHAAAFDAWSRSTHAAAGGEPARVRLLAPFDGTPIRFRDGTVTPEVRNGTWRFVVRPQGQPERVLRVDGVVGGGHMEGGGTQGFVTRAADGTVRFLPWELHRQQGGGWFCNTGARAKRGWVPITPDMQLTDCSDWPPTRILGDELRFTNCQSCHGSQIAVTSDTVAHRYRTSFTSLGVNCESCHGPGRRHVALVGDPAAVARGELSMRPLATLSKDASLGTCFQCHALKDQLRPGYLNGMTLAAYYSLRFPQLGDAAHFPDGRVRSFAYQQGHLSSDCYVNGGMTCTSCHDPHTQAYRDAQGEPLPERLDDRQCTSCHASKGVQAEQHTHHAAGSAGSRCVSCHMPYLQEPEVGHAIRYARSDHAIPIPRPAADSAMGVASACRGCHTDRSEAALDRQVQTWYGEIKPVNPAIAAVMRGERSEDPSAAARELLLPDAQHTAAVFAGLAAFVDRHLTLDRPLPRDAAERMRRLAQHADVDVRALALAALHFSAGSTDDTRRFLAERLQAESESELLVRTRWATALGYLGDVRREQGDPTRAATTYRRALEVEPSNPRLLLNLGLALADAAQLPEAVDAYRASLALDAVQPLAWVNLGIALSRSGDAAGADAAYRRALAINAREPLAQFNLANLRLQAGALDDAAAGYRATIDADPSISLAHFYLARILAQRGDLAAAAGEVDAGLAFDPSNADALEMRTQLQALRARGATPGVR